MNEEWRAVVGYEGRYEVSNLGRVRAVARLGKSTAGWVRPVRQTVLATHFHKYPTVRLVADGGAKSTRNIHSLVAAAWLGPRPDGQEVCHNDGDRTNNHVENLRYGSSRDNALDSVKHGTNRNARKTHCKRGHAFTPENTRIRAKRGSRRCLTCAREQGRASKARLRGAA